MTHILQVAHDVVWRVGEWRCEYRSTGNPQTYRVVVFLGAEPIIDQPCSDAEDAVRRSHSFHLIIERASRRE